jgi:hypothetical protein
MPHATPDVPFPPDTRRTSRCSLSRNSSGQAAGGLALLLTRDPVGRETPRDQPAQQLLHLDIRRRHRAAIGLLRDRRAFQEARRGQAAGLRDELQGGGRQLVVYRLGHAVSMALLWARALPAQQPRRGSHPRGRPHSRNGQCGLTEVRCRRPPR